MMSDNAVTQVVRMAGGKKKPQLRRISKVVEKESEEMETRTA